MDILLAPITEKAAEGVGGGTLFRKQVLKHGTLSYKGRKLTFNKEYSEGLTKAFSEGAYDSVPFVLADEKNRHTMAPERARGEILGLIPTEDGLDAILRLSEEAVTIVKDNPKFGVSVRIVENLERGDGYKAPAAIQHVLGTWDPRMTGMSPWEAVEMSTEDADEVIDLTKEGEGEMPFNEEQEARLKALLDLPEEQFSALLNRTEATAEAEDTEDEELSPELEAELERILNEETAEDVDTDAKKDVEQETAKAEEKELVKLSTEDEGGESVELANLRDEQAALRKELAAVKWEKSKGELLDMGVPPHMVDLAEPVLTAEDTSIELSNGDAVDVKATVRTLLEQAAGYVDLSTEKGHQGDSEGDTLSDMHKAADAAGWE